MTLAATNTSVPARPVEQNSVVSPAFDAAMDADNIELAISIGRYVLRACLLPCSDHSDCFRVRRTHVPNSDAPNRSGPDRSREVADNDA